MKTFAKYLLPLLLSLSFLPVLADREAESPTLTVLTPETVYGTNDIQIEARLLPGSTAPLTAFTAYCTVAGETYVHHFTTAETEADGSCRFRFDTPLRADYGTPVRYELRVEADGQTSATVNAQTTPYLFKPHRRTVVEEITGMWCPNCTSGTMAMDSLALLYPDDFIGIALHSRDALQQDNYVAELPFEVLPSAYFNRKYLERRPTGMVTQGDQAYFILGDGGWGTKFEQYQAEPTVADLSVEAVYDGQNVQLATETRFAVNLLQNTYQIAFVVVENEVKDDSYYQYNFLSGTGIHAGGYENLPYVIENPVFNHVARTIYNSINGIPHSVPSVLEAGETYTFDYEMALPRSVVDPGHVQIVALLMDTQTGEIVNANQTALRSATGAGSIGAADCSALHVRQAGSTLLVRYAAVTGRAVHYRLYNDRGQQVAANTERQPDPVVEVPLRWDGQPGWYIVSATQGSRTTSRKIQVH